MQRIVSGKLDIVIKSQLFAHRRSGSYTEAKKHKIKERERLFQEFYFKRKRVCRKSFCFLHGIDKKKMVAKEKSLDVDDLIPRVYGRVGKPKQKKNALKYFSVVMLKTTPFHFLDVYQTIETHELNSSFTFRQNKRRHFQNLLKSWRGTESHSTKFTILLRIWNDLCLHIVIPKPHISVRNVRVCKSIYNTKRLYEGPGMQ